MEEAEHDQCGEDGSGVVEGVCPGHADLSHGIAEKDKSGDGGEDGEIGYGCRGEPPLVSGFCVDERH